MKKLYSIPQTTIVKINMRSALMDISIVHTNEINERNAGLVKEDRGSSSSDYNVWEDDWSK